MVRFTSNPPILIEAFMFIIEMKPDVFIPSITDFLNQFVSTDFVQILSRLFVLRFIKYPFRSVQVECRYFAVSKFGKIVRRCFFNTNSATNLKTRTTQATGLTVG